MRKFSSGLRKPGWRSTVARMPDPTFPPVPAPTSATPRMPSAAPGVRVLLDTNVVLDVLLRRQPWLTEAQPMWEARDAGTIIACLPVSALTNLYYIGRKQVGREQIMAGIRYCVTNFELVSLERQDAEYALGLSGPDFEDNLQIACAVRVGVLFLVTRDPADYAAAPVPLQVGDPPALMRYLSKKRAEDL